MRLAVNSCLPSPFAGQHMTDPSDQPSDLDAKAKIDILLKEYDTLRTEILQRINSRFAIVGLLGALLAFVLSKFEWQPENLLLDLRWPITVCGLALLLGTWWRFGIIIRGLAARVRSIETRVNKLAGEELLSWETHFGWGRFGKTH